MLQDVTEHRSFPVDRWERLHVLGRGGQGTTTLVRSVLSGEVAALKQIHAQHLVDLKQLELFFREGAVLATLEHPGIPKILEVFTVRTGASPAELFIAQTYFDGETLAARTAGGLRPSVADVRRWGLELLQILTYLHSRVPPVYHRDIKPSNVMIRPDGSAALIDFGAVATGFARVDASTLVGTPGFSAPEQFAGIVTPRTELFALGATLWATLTGLSPVPDPDTGRLAIPDGLPAPLAAFLHATTALEPARRPPNAEAARVILATDPIESQVPDESALSIAINPKVSVDKGKSDHPDDISDLQEPEGLVNNPFAGRWLRLPPQPREPKTTHRQEYRAYSLAMGHSPHDSSSALAAIAFFVSLAGLVIALSADLDGVETVAVGGPAIVFGLFSLASLFSKDHDDPREDRPLHAVWGPLFIEGAVVAGRISRLSYTAATHKEPAKCNFRCLFDAGAGQVGDVAFGLLGQDANILRHGDIVPVLRIPGKPASAVLAITTHAAHG